MADVSGCVEEYRLCCQPSVSLMKIGMQVSCHSFSMSVHGNRASTLQRPFFPFTPPSLQKAGHYSYSQTGSQARVRERERGRERERESEREGERVRKGGGSRGGGEKREGKERRCIFVLD